MQPFSTSELVGMQTAQEAAMQDLCILQIYSETVNTYGQPEPTWTDGRVLRCGLDPTRGDERHSATNANVLYDATLRLPIDTTVDMRDRIKVIHRFGVAVPAQVYEIVAPARRGATCVKLELRRVTL